MMQSNGFGSGAVIGTVARTLAQDALVVLLVVTLQATLAFGQPFAASNADQRNGQLPQTAPAASAQKPAPSYSQLKSPLVIPAGTKLPLALVRPLSVTKSKPGDSVYLQITFPITAGHQMLVPPGTYVQGTIDKVIKRDRRRALLAFSMRSGSMIFSTGYTATLAGTVDALPTIAGVQTPISVGAQSTVPVASAAVGSTAPPPLPAPSLGDGPRNAMIGVTAAAVVSTAAVVLLTRHQDVEMEAGTPLQIVLPAPVPLDPARVAEAVQHYSVQAANTPPSIVQPSPKKAKMCYDPGTPATPDAVIPGSPATPATVIPGMNGAPPTAIPGTPATPDTVIPGRPGMPAREYPCN